MRQLVGYGRLEGEPVAELLNELYAKDDFFRNFFCPVMKHLRTEVEAAANGACMTSGHALSDSSKAAKPIRKSWPAGEALAQLDPFVLKHTISQLRAVLRHQVRPPKSRAA